MRVCAGSNLVQAKKFVESLPQVVRKEISREDADKLAKLLESRGGGVRVE